MIKYIPPNPVIHTVLACKTHCSTKGWIALPPFDQFYSPSQGRLKLWARCKFKYTNNPAVAMVRICAITVFLVFSVLIKSADSRKYSPSLWAQETACRSFFYNSQVNNDQGWTTVPEECVDAVGAYMEGTQFKADSSGVSTGAESFLTSVTPTGDGKDIVVFDIDETALSNLPYYREHKYGGEAFNATPFNLWVEEGTAPAVPAILQLFNALKAAKFGVVFLTGRSESQREITTKNLYRAGYNDWTELILKSPEESGTTAVVYKSKKRTELAAKGYYIYSSVGDQWSDITGPYVGNRTFKVPNPMYFIA